jgi:hypothetical protein
MWETKGENSKDLEGRRCARRGGARRVGGDFEGDRKTFQAIQHGNNRDAGSPGEDRRTGRRANRTNMRRVRLGGPIGAKVELPREKDHPEKQH